MEKYKIFFKPSAVKEIEAIPDTWDRQQIIIKISQLSDNPKPAWSTRLSGYERFRLRQGAYRVVYGIEDDELTVYAVKSGQH